jgi:hypothetical protein
MTLDKTSRRTLSLSALFLGTAAGLVVDEITKNTGMAAVVCGLVSGSSYMVSATIAKSVQNRSNLKI